MSNTIKLHIDSADALERFLGGDAELEVKVRDQIATDFVDRYMKPLINNEKLQEIGRGVDRQIGEAVAKISKDLLTTKTNEWGGKVEITLQDRIKSMILEAVAKQIDDAVKAQLNAGSKALEKKVADFMDKSEDKLTAYIQATVASIIKDTLARSLKECTAKLSEMAIWYADQTEVCKKTERNIALHL